MMDQKEAKRLIFDFIINAEIGSYECSIPRDKAVVRIGNMVKYIDGLTLYRSRKALKELMDEGKVYYTSQGCPAVESSGEYRELICDAMPPINGYALTKMGFSSEEFRTAYKKWCDELKRWAEGY